jgi:hypothetical protein
MSENNVSLGEATQEAVSNDANQQGQVDNAENVEGNVQESATGENDGGSDPSTTSDDSGETQGKPKRGFEKRISKVVSERDRARQELEYWKEQALKVAQGQPTAPQQQVGQYSGKPVRDMYESEDQYFEALSDWKVEQRLQERDIQQEQKKLVENYATRAQEFAKERPDFFDIINDASDLVIAPETAYIIQKSEVGPRLALHLAENPDVADRLNAMDATSRVYELGKLESKLTSQPKAKVEPKRVSNAPAPITTPKGSAPAVSKDLYDPTLTTAEWIALRAKRR